MDLPEFAIGAEFLARGARWRCTDIGPRTIVAIRVDEAQIATQIDGGPVTTRTISGEEADAIGWFDGPPYGVVEHLFDEDDQEGCEPCRMP